jgi:uncharacterized protein (DUF58 family)
VVVVLLFALFLQAYMHDFNLVYITLFFVFSFAFSAGPLGILNLGNLETKFERQGRFFAHEVATIMIQVHNKSDTTAWAISVCNEGSSIPIEKIEAEKSVLVHLPYEGKKRGHFSYQGGYLESKYPLSTARLTKNIEDTLQGIVYPQPKGKSLDSFLSEDESYYGEEKEFDGLRVYDGSQKLSHIHWASVAKGELSVKTFVKEQQTQHLVFNFLGAGSDDEVRLSQLCLWVLSCEKAHLPFELHLPHKKLSTKKESIDEILSILATY